MALSALRIRRTLTLYSSLLKTHRFLSAAPSSALQSHLSSIVPQNPRSYLRTQALGFRSSSFASSSSRSYNNDDDKISPDTILFEGCDYNHWLITMEFPKDPKPTPEEMVETYVQTLAKVVGSVEEAKKRMYACSTTTYTGFQAVMTEEMSEKFRGLPGVVFILPDSYIDPVNKEYGGDKYINGTIIPRPPPVQYGRSQGRYGDRNRNYDRPRYDRQSEPVQMQQGNQPYGHQGSMQGDGRNPMNQRNQPYDRPGYMQGDGRNYQGQQNYGQSWGYGHGGRDGYHGDPRNTGPPNQWNYNQGYQGKYFSPGQKDFGGDNRNSGPSPGGEYWKGAGSSYKPNYSGHGEPQGVHQREQKDGVQGEQNFGPSPGGEYWKGAGSSYGPNYSGHVEPQGVRQREQKDGVQGEQNFGPSPGGEYWKGAGSSYGPNYSGHGEPQGVHQREQKDGVQGEQKNYTPLGQRNDDKGWQ